MPQTESPPANLALMCALSLAVGVVAGLGAWVFRLLIGLFHNLLFLGQFSAQYDANVHTPASPWGPGVILVPIAGALVVVWLVKNFAPEAKGHGVPEVIDAIYYQGAKIRPVVAVIKSVASALCIGSGGSVGREGPIIQIGAAFGSTLGQIMNIPARQCVTLVAAGAAGGIGATFNAPLGGVVFAVELLVVSVNARNLLPIGLATVVACRIGGALLGADPAFDFPPLQAPDFHLLTPWVLVLFVPFGIVVGLVATLMVRSIYWAEDLFDALPVNAYVRHVLGMTIVGVMIYLLQRYAGHYYVQGVGYATIMDVIMGVLTNPGLLLLLLVLKLAATLLTLGSGGSGGVFSPALYMGATTGALFGLAAQYVLPGVDVPPTLFVLAGMAAMIGGTTGAILTGTVMLMEMTYDIHLTIPVIVTSTVAYGVRRWLSPDSIYSLKLTRRGHITPQGLQAALIEAHTVGDVMSTDFHIVVDPSSVAENTGTTIVVHAGEVAAVHAPLPTSRSTEAQPTRELTYLVVARSTPIVAALQALHAAEAECLLVTQQASGEKKLDDPRVDIVGVAGPREIWTFQHKIVDLLG